METLDDERDMNDLRAIIGTICLIFGLIFSYGCLVWCAIKCDQDKNNNAHKTRIMHINSPATIQIKGHKFQGLV